MPDIAGAGSGPPGYGACGAPALVGLRAADRGLPVKHAGRHGGTPHKGGEQDE